MAKSRARIPGRQPDSNGRRLRRHRRKILTLRRKLPGNRTIITTGPILAWEQGPHRPLQRTGTIRQLSFYVLAAEAGPKIDLGRGVPRASHRRTVRTF